MRRRIHQPSQPGTAGRAPRRGLIALILIAVAAAAAIAIFRALDTPNEPHASSKLFDDVLSGSLPETTANLSALPTGGDVYPYSVIPGGVHSVGEFVSARAKDASLILLGTGAALVGLKRLRSRVSATRHPPSGVSGLS